MRKRISVLKWNGRWRTSFVPWLILLVFSGGLLVTHFYWEDGFAVIISLAGAVGAVFVLSDVRQTRHIAKAEFIRDLQTGFSSDDNIQKLWRKLLLNEEVEESDRALISSYLTFFETIYILHSNSLLDLKSIDDLFRNRFFRALGNEKISDVIARSKESFANICNLADEWHKYLAKYKKHVPNGYYAFKIKMANSNLVLKQLNETQVDDLMELQSRVLDKLKKDGHDWLRHNTREHFIECLKLGNNVNENLININPDIRTIGVYSDNTDNARLIAAAILFDAGNGEESIQKHLLERDGVQVDSDAAEEKINASVNLKLVLVDSEYRGFGLASSLVGILTNNAYSIAGKNRIICTIHPLNTPSIKTFKRLGYVRRGEVSSSYGLRLAFEKIADKR